jgi:hypothetical protein
MPYDGGTVSITTPLPGTGVMAGTTVRIAGETTPRDFYKYDPEEVEAQFPPDGVTISVDGANPALTTPLTAGWEQWETSLKLISPGLHTVVVEASWNIGGSYLATTSITLNVPQITVGALPPGASLQRLVVPAFWTLESVDPKFQSAWDALKQAGPSVAIVVFGANYVAATKNVINDQTRPQHERDKWLKDHIDRLDEQPGMVLGYVSTRKMDLTLQPINEILNGKPAGAQTGDDSVKAWYDIFGGHIDGIYFDELVVPEVPNSVADAQQVIGQFRAVHPTTAADARLMILAGQCADAYVVGPEIDWALLWEGRIYPDPPKLDAPYRRNFTARLEQPNQPSLRPIPSWWKDPANRSKIVHVVHNCDEPSRQGALSLANERNAGKVFVMDRRGGPAGQLYDHMPPYWNVEVQEVNSYYDFGFDPLRVLRAAGRYGVAQPNILHAWPNFEAAWYGTTHVRGTFLIHDNVPEITRVPLQLAALPADAAGQPPLHDIPRVWHAAHRYAQQTLNMATAIPVFEQDPNFALIVFDANVVQPVQVPLANTPAAPGTYEEPTFSEPGWVIRNINRVTQAPSICTFQPDNPNKPQGVDQYFNCYTVNAQHVTWRDVQTSTYIAQL